MLYSLIAVIDQQPFAKVEATLLGNLKSLKRYICERHCISCCLFNGYYVLNQELEAIKARVREMEEEAEKLKEMQSDYEKQMNLSSSSLGTSLLNLPMTYRINSSVMP